MGSLMSPANQCREDVGDILTEPTVYHPYPKRVECPIICRCYCKRSTLSSGILRRWVLVRSGAWTLDASEVYRYGIITSPLCELTGKSTFFRYIGLSEGVESARNLITTPGSDTSCHNIESCWRISDVLRKTLETALRSPTCCRYRKLSTYRVW